MNTLLKLAVCSLAAEAVLCRGLERKALERARTFKIMADKEDVDSLEDANHIKQDLERSAKAYNEFWGLERYRKTQVRKEARCNQLAYGFLRGKEYVEMEESTYSNPDWTRVEKIIFAYSDEDPRTVKQHFEQWMQKVHPPVPMKTDHVEAKVG